jgi:LmbE family N-acetylglucosaminyl deacetylase
LRVLVIVAHPDDDVLGMGGTLLRHSKKGDTIKIIYLATGITARLQESNSKVKTSKEISKLRDNTKQSCKILGVKNYSFYDFPDNEMDTIPLLKITKIVENEINLFNPDRIYTSHFGDLNIDHKLVYQACLTACRPIHVKTPELITFEILSSSEWNYPTSFQPNYFVDISSFIEDKCNAMKCFKNEIRKFPHPRSVEGIKISAKKWGTVCGKKNAEAFQIIRIIE